MNQALADLVGKQIQPVMRPGVTAPILLPGIVDTHEVKHLCAALEHRLQNPPEEQMIGGVLRVFRVVSGFEQVLLVLITETIIEGNPSILYREKIQPQPAALGADLSDL